MVIGEMVDGSWRNYREWSLRFSNGDLLASSLHSSLHSVSSDTNSFAAGALELRPPQSGPLGVPFETTHWVISIRYADRGLPIEDGRSFKVPAGRGTAKPSIEGRRPSIGVTGHRMW